MVFRHKVTDAGLKRKQCGVERVWFRRVCVRSLQVREDYSNFCRCRVGFNFAGADKKIQSTQAVD